jgi:Raf kinase inhibitor-like YbhB/YbcL family protein
MADNGFRVTSSLFGEGGTIPTSAAYTWAGGRNISPDLQWTGAPEGTRSFALSVWDPDAPTGVGFTHWVLFNLDPGLTGLDAGAGAGGKNPPGSTLGFTDFGDSEYGGMAPPEGDDPHHYHFTVYALDEAELDSGPTTTYPKFQFLIRGHVLAQATLIGRFGA